MERSSHHPDVRKRKLRRIRAAIRVGVYENDLKLHIAVDRLIEKLEKKKQRARRRGLRAARSR